jgi:hypothetical protein
MDPAEDNEPTVSTSKSMNHHPGLAMGESSGRNPLH